MNRRWQKEGRGRYETLESYNSIAARLPSMANSIQLCDTADIYATYSALHSKGKTIEIATNAAGGFHFFMVEGAEGPKSKQAEPFGRKIQEAVIKTGIPTGRVSSSMAHERSQEPDAMAVDDAGPPGCAAPAAPTSADQQTDDDLLSMPPAFVSKSGKRVEPVVPVSSKHTGLTMELIQRLFNLGSGMVARHMLLAIVDDDGSVSLLRVFNYVQPPFEGPETLPPVDGAEMDSDQE